MSFSALKKRKNSLDALKEKAKAGESKSFKDDRYWYLTRDKADNGFAIIRFLDVSPADQEHADGEEVAPWVHYYTHQFKNKQGRWYYENCLTSIGKECPACEANSELWAEDTKESKVIVRQRKRKEHYVANIRVIKDSQNPDAEGKNFLFRFGPKIFEKISDAMDPEFEDEVGFNPFDFWEGANFKLKARKGDGDFITYDKSEFDSISPLADTDKEMEAIWKASYALHEIVAEENFKDYDVLKEKFAKITGTKSAPVESAKERKRRELDLETEDKKPEHTPEDKPDPEADDEEDLDYFRSKLDED